MGSSLIWPYHFDIDAPGSAVGLTGGSIVGLTGGSIVGSTARLTVKRPRFDSKKDL